VTSNVVTCFALHGVPFDFQLSWYPKEWVSLSGIVFATGNGGAIAYPLALQNGWGIYGDGSWFAPPQYFLSDGICSLQGLISGDLID
jgi:hypothetical protein